MKSTALLIALFAAASCAGVSASPPADIKGDTIEVMVLGTYHMGNPGADLVNAKADNMLAPARQAELDALVSRLGSFQPTAIMVDSESPRPDLLDEGYLAD